MKEKFLAALIAEGLSEEQATVYADLIVIEKESEIVEKVQKIRSTIPKKPVTPDQSEVDRRVTQAVKTAIENYEKKHNLKEGKIVTEEPDKLESKKDASEISPEIKALMDTISTMNESIKGLTEKQKKDERALFVKKALTDAKIPESMHKRFIDNAEATPEEFTILVDEFRQELADLGIKSMQTPGTGELPTFLEASAKEAAEERNSSNKNTGGVQKKELL